MTTPEHESSAPQPPASEVRDRVYRSSGGIAGGVLLLAIIGWLGFDALFTGHGRTPWMALAAMILIVPLVVAFSLRPAVYANDERLRIRNPFRVIVLPWGQVAALRSRYSNEVVSQSGTTYQLWAVPVSMRARKRAIRQEARAAGAGQRGSDRVGRLGTRGVFGSPGVDGPGGTGRSGPVRAASDQTMSDLQELHEAREHDERAQGEVTVRWAYEIVGPAVAGAVVLAILLAVG
ncbi:PH domain-containing protein [Streptomyces glomeratus]|uniref:PH domain-containing protein n=1 Tax=Streptomyces glomeratus TaxID=284452 RepID=A0ABP6L3X8_9ACTN|nr:PH domain-containing protein [Streptomyces glomeratus]MCF1507221.1 PH domain-containing protein [Streptomyces glomeratus]